MNTNGSMHALLAALCVVNVSLKLPRRPKEADSFRPLLGLDHPVSSIPAATTPREAPKLPRCTAQPAQLRLRIISWQLFVLCMRVPTTMFRRRPSAATHPLKPSRSSSSRASKETTWPSAQSLGLDRDACHTLCLSNPTLYTLTAAVHDLHMHRCRTHTTHWQIGRLGEASDVNVVSPKFRCRPELPDKRRAGARC